MGCPKGFPAIIERIKKMRDEIRKEQNYDAAGFIFKPMYAELRRLIEYYAENENELFAQAMTDWGTLAGFHGHHAEDGTITYHAVLSLFKLQSTRSSYHRGGQSTLDHHKISFCHVYPLPRHMEIWFLKRSSRLAARLSASKPLKMTIFISSLLEMQFLTVLQPMPYNHAKAVLAQY